MFFQMFQRHLKFGAIFGTSIASLNLATSRGLAFAKSEHSSPLKISVYELTNLKIEADCLIEGNEFKKVYQKLENYADCEEVEIQWRRAKVAYKLANQQGENNEARIFYLKRAMKIAEKALELGKVFNNRNFLKTKKVFQFCFNCDLLLVKFQSL